MNALILVDLQNDFVLGGALAVPQGDEVIEVANARMADFPLVVATQDWHPADHGSFAENHPGRQPGDVIHLHGLKQILWPVHCVQETSGAALVPGLNTDGVHEVVRKGTDPRVDSYSGFFDNGRKQATGMTDLLRARGVKHVTIMGLALDYCVKFTALDAISEGFKVALLTDGSRPVDLKPGDGERAVDEMFALGVEIL
ncbi:MAG: bifunctional nicotinamidase/pyrazinamidase [Planctomycetota bacterium]